MKKLFFALLLAMTVALSVTPAFAQGFGVGGSSNTCIGGNTTYEPGSQARDFSLFGCNGTVRRGATVPGDAVVFGGNLVVEQGATVNGNVAIFGGATDIAGEVRGDVAIMGGTVNLQPSAVVDGTLRLLGGSYNQMPGSSVRGGINRENGFRFGPDFGRTVITPVVTRPFDMSAFNFVRDVITALAMAALGALLVVFFPEPTRRVMSTAERSAPVSLGVGCLTMMIVPILLVLFAITLIGIPVTMVLAIAWAAAIVFGWIAIGYFAGNRVLDALKVKNIAPVLAVFVGVLVLAFVNAVPCVGGLVSLLIATLGLGAVVLTRFGTRNYPFYPALAPAGYYPPSPTPPATPAGPAPLFPPPATPPPQAPPPAPDQGRAGDKPEER